MLNVWCPVVNSAEEHEHHEDDHYEVHIGEDEDQRLHLLELSGALE